MLWFVLVTLILTGFGCNDREIVEPDLLPRIRFDSGPHRLYSGESIQLSADVSGSSDTTLVWSVKTGSGTVTQQGIYSAADTSAQDPMRVTVAAILRVSPGIKAEFVLDVYPRDFFQVVHPLGVERGMDVCLDGGIIVALAGGIRLGKFDSSGQKEWTGEFGDGQAYSVFQTSDEGYAITGTVGFPSTTFIMKTDAFGNEIWRRNISSGSLVGYGHSISQTQDGGYIIAGLAGNFVGNSSGFTDSGAVYRCDALGNLLWVTALGGRNIRFDRTVQQTNDGGFVAIATHAPPPLYQSDGLLLVKLSAGGSIDWERRVNISSQAEAASVVVTSDGGYAVSGSASFSSDIGREAALARLDPNGNVLWIRTYGTPANDWVAGLVETNTGGFVLAGWTFRTNTGNSNAYVVSTDANGALQWTRTFGSPPIDAQGYSVRKVGSSGFMIVGSYGGHLLLIRASAEGRAGFLRVLGIRGS